MKKIILCLALALGMFSLALAGDIKPDGVSQRDLVKYLENVRDAVNSLKLFAGGTFPITSPGLKINAQNTQEYNCTAFTYVDGNMTIKTKSAANGTLGTGRILPGKWGTWRVQMTPQGTLGIRKSQNTTSYPGYSTAQAAINAVRNAGSGNLSLGYILIGANSTSSCKFGNSTQNLGRNGIQVSYVNALWARYNGNLTLKGL